MVHHPLFRSDVFRTIYGWLQQYVEDFVELLLPPTCVGCGARGAHFCPRCVRRIRYIRPPYCLRCGQPLTEGNLCHRCQRGYLQYLDRARAMATFSSPLREAIHHFKYRSHLRVGAILGELMAYRLRRDSLRNFVLIPVPLHQERERARGYNQAALLARYIAQQLDLPVWETALLRVRKTQPQVNLHLHERMANVRNAFAVAPHADVRGRSILLIDDVMTTGSTLEACAHALKQAGATHVAAYVLARALYVDVP